MNKYIDAEKLIKAIEDKGLDCSLAIKMERLDTLALIDELQQEQPEGGCSEKPNNLLSEWTEPRKTRKQEQTEEDLEKEIDAVWNSRFDLGWDEHSCLTMNRAGFESFARHFYKLRLNARKEE